MILEPATFMRITSLAAAGALALAALCAHPAGASAQIRSERTLMHPRERGEREQALFDRTTAKVEALFNAQALYMSRNGRFATTLAELNFDPENLISSFHGGNDWFVVLAGGPDIGIVQYVAYRAAPVAGEGAAVTVLPR
ncbi:hypothetical protein [Longimicrobium terrae]|uniref:Uncharacterized protein n=1 Tax=Longimicrobium terrae TaxID=1639882 RepID=A0A841GYD4_9BACT|nr:hypothetical protein [Longimicrobium terrae]MBB4636389.1 hypothetical protein [Longimicrobium terrae]MBB6070785.1 hypothetical protein [Longimicrobium terrae]NNC29765.1 hypothetical protein [Longimicrobium terrae]